MISRLRSFAACLGLCLTATTWAAESASVLQNLRSTASVTWAENLSRTSAIPNQKSARVFAATVTGGHEQQLSSGWLLQTDAELGGKWVPQFDALDTFTAGAEASLRYKFGLGPLAPTLAFNAALTGAATRERGRSGWQADAGMRLAKRFTENWRVAAGFDWEEFFARRKPFDITNHRAVLETTWDITDRWQVNLGGSRLWGQLTANAAPGVWAQAIGGGLGPVIFNTYNRLAWEATDTYGPGWVAYRINCHADSWWIELAPALTEKTSLALRYEFVKVINEIDIRYDAAFWSLSVAHQF